MKSMARMGTLWRAVELESAEFLEDWLCSCTDRTKLF